MGRRGPAKKPRALKAVDGTLRKSREPENAAEDPDVAIPEPPDELADAPWGDAAVGLWFDLAPLLRKRQLIARDFALDFMALCDAHGRWLYYRGDVAEHGISYETTRGNQSYRPEYAAMNRAWDEVRTMTARFGLNPANLGDISALEQQSKGKLAKYTG